MGTDISMRGEADYRVRSSTYRASSRSASESPGNPSRHAVAFVTSADAWSLAVSRPWTTILSRAAPASMRLTTPKCRSWELRGRGRGGGGCGLKRSSRTVTHASSRAVRPSGVRVPAGRRPARPSRWSRALRGPTPASRHRPCRGRGRYL